MASVTVNIRLKSFEDEIVKLHGRQRPLTTPERFVLLDLADVVLQEVQRQWPVDTGTSRDNWNTEVSITPGNLVLKVENPMFYASYVHRKGGSPDDPLWRRLVPAVYRRAKPGALALFRQRVRQTERRLAQAPAGQQVSILRELLRGVANAG